MSQRTDSEIEQWVLRELSFGKKIESKELCVSCCTGVVTLAGSVEHYRDKIAAEIAALRAPDVIRAINLIALKPCMALIEQRYITLPLSPPSAEEGVITTVRADQQPMRTAHHV